MNTVIETYLAEAAAHLGQLPAAKRTEELREMRQHLLNSLIVNREMGMSEAEAAVSTLAQFGPPEELAKSLVWVWHRGEKKRKRDFLRAAAFIMACLLVLPRIGLILEQPYLPHTIQSQRPSFWIDMTILLWQTPIFFLTGAVSGLAFPQRAVVTTGLALAAMDFYMFASSLLNHLMAAQPLPLILSDAAISLVALLHYGVPHNLPIILGAWAGSRWRKIQWGKSAVLDFGR